MNKLGKIPFPEQYAPAGSEVPIKDSVQALAFFEELYPEGGTVLLGNMRLQAKNFEIIDLLVWIYVNCSDGKPDIVSPVPVFKLSVEKFNGCKILGMTPHENEVFSSWKGKLYCSAYTYTGEICIKKVRSLLCAAEATRVIEMQSGRKVEDIYPVELYSHSEQKFIGVCWAVTMEDDSSRILWHPVCLLEQDAIAAYSVEDLTEHFINVDETAVIGRDTFRLLYDKNEGYVFQKVQRQKGVQKIFTEQLKIHAQESPDRVKQPQAEKAKCMGKLIKMPLPKKQQAKN